MPVQTRSQTHSRDAATAPALAPAHPEVARRQRSGQRAPPPLRRLSPYGETLARYLPRLGKSVGDGVLGNPRVGKSRLSRKGRQPFQTEDDSPQLDTPTVARFDSNARHPKGGIGTLRSVEEEEGATEQSNSAAAAATASEAGRAPGSKPWVPSLVVGAPFGDDLSALETADRKVEQWRAILRYHEENLPRAVSPVRRMLNAAVEERSKLDDDSESNTVPKSALPTTAQNAVDSRLDLLHGVLETSRFAPEADNIRAALHAYATGAIRYADHRDTLTVFYGGRLVDRCDSYAAFAADRPARLDRYAAAYGPGWLWYEPPLRSAAAGESLKKGCALVNTAARRGGATHGGYWLITMGFRRRKAWVSRDAAPAAGTTTTTTTATAAAAATTRSRRAGVSAKRATTATAATTATTTAATATAATATTPGSGLRPSPARNSPLQDFLSSPQSTPSPPSSSDGRKDDEDCDDRFPMAPTVPDPTAPLLFFSMHLDSGASKPTLYEGDLRAVGIDPDHYAAQSATWANGIAHRMRLRLFELDVGIYASGSPDGADLSAVGNLVSPAAPARVWPAEPAALGATMPVLALSGDAPDDPLPPTCDRLSGMLPFQAAYLSAAPGTHTLWIGEDRRDVLGAARMPGQLRYAGFRTATDGGPLRRRRRAGEDEDEDEDDDSDSDYQDGVAAGRSKKGKGLPPRGRRDRHPRPLRRRPPPTQPARLNAGHPPWIYRDLGSPDRIIFEHHLKPTHVDDNGDDGNDGNDGNGGVGSSSHRNTREHLYVRDVDLGTGASVLSLRSRRVSAGAATPDAENAGGETPSRKRLRDGMRLRSKGAAPREEKTQQGRGDGDDDDDDIALSEWIIEPRRQVRQMRALSEDLEALRKRLQAKQQDARKNKDGVRKTRKAGSAMTHTHGR